MQNIQMNSESQVSVLRWGILGTGGIAKKFAAGLTECGLIPPVAIGSRTLETAQRFALEFGGVAYSSYQEVLDDPEVDAVYISLPHHLHVEWTIKCAQAGKHILCEKPFTWDFDDAKRALQIVKDCDVFFMEAFMYRCHPQTLAISNAVRSGDIGKLLLMHGEFGYKSTRDRTSFRFDPKVGGGALLDVGCYPISMARMLAGSHIKKAQYTAAMDSGGADSHGAGLLIFDGDFRASFACSMDVQMRNQVTIYGSTGHIVVHAPWFCNGKVEMFKEGDPNPKIIEFPNVKQLWGFQAIVVEKSLSQRQSSLMNWNDTLGNAQVLDGLYKRLHQAQ